MSTITKFLNESQDPKAVEKILGKINGLLTAGEEVEYIAVQKKPVINTSPDCVALTNKRAIFCRPKNFGLSMEFSDHLWKDVVDVHIKEGMLGAEFMLRTNRGSDLMDYLPKEQARRLYQFGQAREEEAREYRRQHDLETNRSGAGGVVINNPLHPSTNVYSPHAAAPAPAPAPAAPAAAAEDPMEKLKKLKQMLEHELITQAEFDERRAAIMATF